MMRTSARMILFPPTRWISFASIARNSFACASGPRSPTSSRNSVPRCASSKRPIRVWVAPVKAPRSWPNISLSTRSRGIAAQLTRTNGLSRRGLASWIALATSSLPVPDSPVISPRASDGATRAIICRTAFIAALVPTICPPKPSSALSCRATRRVCRSSRADDTASSTPSGVSGFSRKLKAPSFVAFTASARPARPLIMITGKSGATSRSRASVAMPSSSPGIIRSSSATSGSPSVTRATASTPLGVSATSYPSPASSAPTILRMFGSSSAMRTVGTYVLRSGGAEEGWICRGSPRPSERSRVVNRCPSEIRSTSIATASIACSIRSSLPVTSDGMRGFFPSASILREYARATGTPIASTTAVANAPSGTTISGPISVGPLGAGAVSWNRELDLRTLAQRTRCGHGAIVRPHCLPGDGEAEARTARLVRDVRLPDRLETAGRDAFAVVGDGDPHRIPPRHFHSARADRDSAFLPRCIDRIEQHVAQRACQCSIVAEHAWKILVYPQIESNAWRHAAARGVAHQLSDIDLRRRTLGQTTELRKAPRHSIEPLRLHRDDIDILLQRVGRLTAQPRQREPDRSQRILDLVRDPARALPERVQTLGFHRLPPPVLELGDHLAHAAAQSLEFGRALHPARRDFDRSAPVVAVSMRPRDERRLRWRRQRLAVPDQLRPAHQLFERPTQLPAQMAGDA